MIKKIILLIAICFFQSTFALAARFNKVGEGTCLSVDKISHVQGQSWQVADTAWQVVTGEVSSTLTQLSPHTIVNTTVEPYHIRPWDVADVICEYYDDNDRVVLKLKRTYTEGEIMAPYIKAINSNGSTGFNTFWNDNTSCFSRASSLETCHYDFMQVNRSGYGGGIVGLPSR